MLIDFVGTLHERAVVLEDVLESQIVSVPASVEFLGETAGVWSDQLVGGIPCEDLAVKVDPEGAVISEVVDEGE